MVDCNKNANQFVTYEFYDRGKWKTISSKITIEAPVSLTVNGDIKLTFMCTPVDLEELAIGFLYNERIIDTFEEIVSVRVCPTSDNVDIWLDHNVDMPKNWRRTSGCSGGFTSIEENLEQNKLIDQNGSKLLPCQISDLIGKLTDAQDLYRRSGGVHTSALSDGDNICMIAEDIGRHNTLDKIAGRMLVENFQPSRRILISTGRISSEMLQKASRIGANYVISRTSPSSLSIQIANNMGITLIGYARRNSFRVYTHDHRVIKDTIADGNRHPDKQEAGCECI